MRVCESAVNGTRAYGNPPNNSGSGPPSFSPQHYLYQYHVGRSRNRFFIQSHFRPQTHHFRSGDTSFANIRRKNSQSHKLQFKNAILQTIFNLYQQLFGCELKLWVGKKKSLIDLHVSSHYSNLALNLLDNKRKTYFT